ncbi:hypothetical protein [Ilyobacter polytropus]|uniref:Uncharacterized protein n=1 Tax=Ilyobacter polytropus (strain ATCC 51220 / DSM 2926 / LMG 16218 / CuHBu1) TaxID=572544 RepID=E3HBR0_ILYPC|nr:hypothetical protein [Ilyobacter polytropus]ADO83822.1 hypothetical protein Ilyop_2051 [Ilyobacter polytropus DSM 2926]
MIKILKKIFKAGNYGTKGNYSIETLNKWVEAGKEFSVIPGHIQDWIKSGYAKTAIPIGGRVKCSSVDDDGFLYGEIKYNEFGKKVTEGGAYENFSIGISPAGDPDHLALLGYAPPHIKELDKAFSEFSEEVGEVEYIEFTEEEVKTEMEVAEMIEKLQSEGYTVEKTEPKPNKTEEEIKAEVKAEFAREMERDNLKAKVMAMVPPSIKGIMEFAVDQAFVRENYGNIIEFSENEKTPMKDHIMKMAEEGGPFKHLFKEFSKELGSDSGPKKSKTADEIIENAQKLMMEV